MIGAASTAMSTATENRIGMGHDFQFDLKLWVWRVLGWKGRLAGARSNDIPSSGDNVANHSLAICDCCSLPLFYFYEASKRPLERYRFPRSPHNEPCRSSCTSRPFELIASTPAHRLSCRALVLNAIVLAHQVRCLWPHCSDQSSFPR